MAAALWDSWQSPEGDEIIQSCCLLTTGADEFMTPIHSRMPVILGSHEQMIWLDNYSTMQELTLLLKPYSGSNLHCYAVSTKVNSSRYVGIDTIIPI